MPSALGRPFVPIVYRVPDAPLVKKVGLRGIRPPSTAVTRSLVFTRDPDFFSSFVKFRETSEDDSMPFTGLPGRISNGVAGVRLIFRVFVISSRTSSIAGAEKEVVVLSSPRHSYNT